MTAGPMVLQVAAILFSEPGLAVFSGRAPDGARVRVVATGKGFLPVVGEVYEVRGAWRRSERYGDQVHGDGDAFPRLMPSGALVRPWLERIPGVGPERARRLVRAYGGRLDRALDGTAIETLAGVIEPERPNLGARIAAAIVHEWARVKGEYETLRWMEEQGIEDLRTARAVSAMLGPRAVEILGADPYVLATVIPWARLDPVGRRLLARRGDVPDVDACRARIVGAVDVALQQALKSGHTAVPKAGFGEGVAERLGLGWTDDLGNEIVEAGLARGALVDAGDIWRVPGCAIMEEELLARFAAMATGRERGGVRLPPPADLRRILAMVERRGRALFPEQREAVLALVGRPLSCLSGGAGTGKTTTCRAVTDLWETLGGRVELTALSGKAALRLGEGAGRTGKGAPPAHTIHKLLLGLRRRADGDTHWGQAPGDGDAPDPGGELPALTDRTLLVVDEASMVDLGLMHELVEAMPTGCRLMLIGDDFQLPPVGFGLVFHHLVDQESVAARLSVVRRQEEGSGIPAIAEAIRSRVLPCLPTYGKGMAGVSFLNVREGRIGAAIERVVSDLGGFGGGPGILMVLAAVNRRGGRPDGTVLDLNARLQAREHGAGSLAASGAPLAVRAPGGTLYAVGDPVTHLRNDYRGGLRNGSLGNVTEVDPETGTVVCAFDGEGHTFSGGGLLDIGLAYALTCHKAQGSQARNVVISLADAPNVEPTWLYTAVTRAEETAVVVGDERVLGEVMRRMPSFERRMTGCTFDLPAHPVRPESGRHPA